MIIRQGKPIRIAVHHSAVKTGNGTLAELKTRAASHNNYHKTKSIGWNCDTPGEFGYKYIRYHHMVSKDGGHIQTQDEKYVLYHASDGVKGPFNYYGIAICLEGNYEVESPTDKQKETLAQLIAQFERTYKVDVIVRGHREISGGTACPGKYVGKSNDGWLQGVIARANKILAGEPEIVLDPVAGLNKQIEALTKENTNLKGQIEVLNNKDYLAEASLEQLLKEVLNKIS